MTSTRLSSAVSLASIALLSATGSVATGDIVQNWYLGSSSYHWKVTHMPDFDQRRDTCCGHIGLPGDGGMYCVPTAAMNLFAYAANHGFPALDPGPGNWQAQSLYDEATFRLLELGVLMSTDAADGTSGGGWKDGATTWTIGYGAGQLVNVHFHQSSDYNVRAYKIASTAVLGSIIEFVYGRYEVLFELEGLPVINRDGGHAVTLTEAYNDGSTRYFTYRDPADSGADTVQSQFTSKQVSITPVSFYYLGGSGGTMTAIDYPSSDGKIRFIDGFMALMPLWGLTYTNTGGIIKLSPMAVAGFGPTRPTITLTPPAFGLADLFHDADSIDSIVLVNVSAAAAVTQLRRVDMLTGEQITLGDFTTLKRFTVGRDGRIYAHDGSKIYCIKPDGTLESATSNSPVPTALAYDDKLDQIVILSVPQRKVTRLTKTFQVVSTFTIPAGIPLSGDGSVIVNPFDGHVYFDSEASSVLYQLVGTTGPFTLNPLIIPCITTPKGLAAGDDGALYVSNGGSMVVLRNERGAWIEDTDSPFAGMPVANRLSFARSRTNFDPTQHTGPGWSNIDPDDLLDIGFEVPDCLADLDGNGIVDGADLARLLGTWNTAAVFEDLDANGVVNGADMAILLGAWGPCP